MNLPKHVFDTGNNDGALTGIRFFAAMHVVIFHYGLNAEPFNSSWLKELMRLGPVAVSFFFVLSGYIMAIAYDKRPWDGTMKQRFLWARFARIYPVYLLAMIFAIGLYTHYSPFDADTTVTYIGKICMNLFMVQAWFPGLPMAINGPAWSLSVEIFFYALFPFFFPMIRTWSKSALWALALITGIATIVWAYCLLHIWFPMSPSKLVREFQIFFPLWHVPSFVIGVAFGLLTLRGSFSRWPKWLLGGVLWVCLLSFVFLPQGLQFMSRFFLSQFGSGLHSSTMAHNGLLALPFALFLVTLYQGPRYLNFVFGNHILQRLGHASYAIYLLQYPVWTFLRFEVFKPLNIVDPTQKFFINCVVLIGLALIVYHLYENPLRRWLIRRPTVKKSVSPHSPMSELPLPEKANLA